MCEVICPYKDKCSDYGKQCSGCKRNTGKRSYYDPDYNPYYPHYPGWTPWYPYITYWWGCPSPTADVRWLAPTQITCGDSTTSGKSYFIQS